MVKQPDQPNVTTNHLSQHNSTCVNVIELEDGGNSLKYLRRMDNSYEIITMVSSLREVKGEPIVIRGSTKEIKSVNPVEVTKSQPIVFSVLLQQSITNLKTVPWNFGKGSSSIADCGAVLPKNNPLCLPERVIKSMKKPTEKVMEGKTI